MFLFPEHYDDNEDQLQGAVTEWLRKNKPDAIFHDGVAFPRMLRNAGYRVPKDIALASTTVLEAGEPGVAAGLDQNSEEIGRVAVLVVLSQINDNARGMPAITRQILVQGRWVDGTNLPQRG
jgi:LacI family transcriptional regulator